MELQTFLIALLIILVFFYVLIIKKISMRINRIKEDVYGLDFSEYLNRREHNARDSLNNHASSQSEAQYFARKEPNEEEDFPIPRRLNFENELRMLRKPSERLSTSSAPLIAAGLRSRNNTHTFERGLAKDVRGPSCQNTHNLSKNVIEIKLDSDGFIGNSLATINDLRRLHEKQAIDQQESKIRLPPYSPSKRNGFAHNVLGDRSLESSLIRQYPDYYYEENEGRKRVSSCFGNLQMEEVIQKGERKMRERKNEYYPGVYETPNHLKEESMLFYSPKNDSSSGSKRINKKRSSSIKHKKNSLGSSNQKHPYHIADISEEKATKTYVEEKGVQTRGESWASYMNKGRENRSCNKPLVFERRKKSAAAKYENSRPPEKRNIKAFINTLPSASLQYTKWFDSGLDSSIKQRRTLKII